jgi:hypothetical protein
MVGDAPDAPNAETKTRRAARRPARDCPADAGPSFIAINSTTIAEGF